MLERIHDARRMAQWVVVAMHNQDIPGDEPQEHAIAMFHAMVDAGADILVGTGPHQDRGIEIYKGRPIFYGLGDFILQNDTVLLEPQEHYDHMRAPLEQHPGGFLRCPCGIRGRRPG